MAPEENFAVLRIKKAQQEPDEGRFASPTWSDNPEALSRLHREADVVQDMGPFGVAKTYPVKPYLWGEGQGRPSRDRWLRWLARLCRRRAVRPLARLCRRRAVRPFLHHRDRIE